MIFSVAHSFSIKSILILIVYEIVTESRANNVRHTANWDSDNIDDHNNYTNTDKYPQTTTDIEEQSFEPDVITKRGSTEYTTTPTELPCEYPNGDQIVRPTKIINGPMYAEVVLTCMVGTKTPKYVYWRKRAKSSLHLIQSENNTKMLGVHSLLMVTPRTDDDFGYYSCEVGHRCYNYWEVTKLVQYPVVDLLTSANNTFRWTVTSHLPLEKISLRIKEEGEIDWLEVHIPISEAEVHSETHKVEYNLYEKKYRPGKYSAILSAKNVKGWSNTDNPPIAAYVELGGTEIDGPTKEINSALYAKAVLVCTAEEEMPEYVRWHKDEMPIFSNGQKFMIKSSGKVSILEVTPQADDDFGLYTCEIGYYRESMKLVEYPVVDMLTPVNGTTFRWRVTSHLPLERIEIELAEKRERYRRLVDIPISEVSNYTYEVEYNLDKENYQPGNYSASLRARNNAGWSIGRDSRNFRTVDLEFLRGDAIRPMTKIFTVLCLYLLTRIL